ncbi:hypothetical protein NITHO_1010012 [Nitrolancea hollandica Lb]|uniref:Uncharacterized protein n=1 Tax=Nitrolancea hollandica Lb TaxID=1129897 RepID=I4ECA4_9BACT|nr:hypothetical protein NITHO_1010012 [Nitrolancea hollandica Lb]
MSQFIASERARAVAVTMMNLLLGLDAKSNRDQRSRTPLTPTEICWAEGPAHLFDLLPVQTDTDLVVPDGQIMSGQTDILTEEAGADSDGELVILGGWVDLLDGTDSAIAAVVDGHPLMDIFGEMFGDGVDLGRVFQRTAPAKSD